MVCWDGFLKSSEKGAKHPSYSIIFLGFLPSFRWFMEASGGRSRAFRLCPTGEARGASDGRAGGAGGGGRKPGTETCLKRVMKLGELGS